VAALTVVLGAQYLDQANVGAGLFCEPGALPACPELLLSISWDGLGASLEARAEGTTAAEPFFSKRAGGTTTADVDSGPGDGATWRDLCFFGAEFDTLPLREGLAVSCVPLECGLRDPSGD
ncbi:hypothetical protein MTO96_031866, partial [Rhipicephalus appendiculatus]